jgi:hypothetical protein
MTPKYFAWLIPPERRLQDEVEGLGRHFGAQVSRHDVDFEILGDWRFASVKPVCALDLEELAHMMQDKPAYEVAAPITKLSDFVPTWRDGWGP